MTLDLRPEDRWKPTIYSSQIIRHVDGHQAQLVNRNRNGSMLIAGQTLFIMEVEPAAYIALAANEAEKAAEITLVDMRPFGSFGRLYLGGEERDIDVGWRAAVKAIEGVAGKPATPESRVRGRPGDDRAGGEPPSFPAIH